MRIHARVVLRDEASLHYIVWPERVVVEAWEGLSEREQQKHSPVLRLCGLFKMLESQVVGRWSLVIFGISM